MNAKGSIYSLLLIAALLTSCTNYEEASKSPAYTRPDQPKKDMLDIHFHAACISEKFGCYISKASRGKYFGIKFKAYLNAFGVTEEIVSKQNDAKIFKKAHLLVKDSRYISAAVVLAMDGVYDHRGELDTERTQVYFPNEYVARQVNLYENLLFGASINPDRKNAVKDLFDAKKWGAVLLKWLPCTMLFDPADQKYTEFYRTLVQLKLPLLTHVGTESSIDNSAHELCDPLRLELPLKLGVTVIAAHMGSRGDYQGQPAYQRLQSLLKKYPNLYVDNSAILHRNRPADFLTKVNFGERVLYGSDYPVLNVTVFGYELQMLSRFDQYLSENWKIFIHGELTNILDKDVAVKKAMGVPESNFYLYKKLFEIPENKAKSSVVAN